VPSCPLRALTGVPCPFCGMTRGTIALVHGDVLHSLALNPGVLLAVVTAAFLLWRRPRLSLPTWVPCAVVGTLWAFQLLKYATGRPL
jgi:Protein of unknown function (DUF2752)